MIYIYIYHYISHISLLYNGIPLHHHSFSAPECPGSHGATGSPVAPKPAETAEACNAPAPEMGQARASRVDGGDPSGFP